MEKKTERPLRHAIDDVQTLLKRSQHAESKVLECYGICEEHQEIVEITRLVSKLCNWLEDALCHALLDISCLREAVLSHQLMYQNM